MNMELEASNPVARCSSGVLMQDHTGKEDQDIAPIQASFELDDEDRNALKDVLHFPLPASAVIQAECTYGKTLRARSSRPSSTGRDPAGFVYS